MSEQEKTDRRAVREYLNALDDNRPKRGRKRTPESIQSRLDAIDSEYEESSQIKRLELAQERLDLNEELEKMSVKVDLDDVEADFVASAKRYGELKGITYQAWREIGIAPGVLKAAGISRSERGSR